MLGNVIDYMVGAQRKRDTMNEAVAKLAFTRQVEAECKAEIAEAEVALKATRLGKHLELRREYLRVVQLNIADATTEVRRQALAIYDETGSKSPHPAVKVKIYTVLKYNLAEALNYAREHLPKAVKLDKRAFEKAAKAIGPDFVTISQEPRASIARNLDEFTEETNHAR